MVNENFIMLETNGKIPFTSRYRADSGVRLPEWVLKFKKDGLENYINHYSDIKPDIANFIKDDDFVISNNRVYPSLDLLLRCPMFDVNAYTLVLVNGKYSPELSFEEELPFSVFTDGIAESLADDGYFLEKKLNVCNNVYVSLNSAYLSNGVIIEIKDNEEISKPIHIISIVTTLASEKLFLNPRVVVNVGKNVNVDIIESNFSLTEQYFENKVCQFNVGINSNVNHYKLYNISENSLIVENNFIDIGKGARFNQVEFIKNCGLFRQYYTFDIEEKANVESNISVEEKNKQDCDIDVLLRHSGDNAYSKVSLFSALNDYSKMFLNTCVECEKNISGVETSQISKILLNSINSVGRIVPLQKIFSEKVKAYHGAVVSAIPSGDLFFLQSRGIELEEAKKLILKSYLANILQNIHNEKIYDAFYNIIWL